jgi:hypothetical protein
LNRPLIDLVRPRAELSKAWDLHAVRFESTQPDLCIVISTHKRPEACANLLKELHAALPAPLRNRAQVIVLEDLSDADYTAVCDLGERLFEKRLLFLRSRRWLGKQGYYLTFQAAFELIRKLQPVHTLFIQDDISLAPDFFVEAFALWGSIRDRKKAVLSLVSFECDEVRGRWTRYKRRELIAGRLRKTQWFDLPAFLVGRYFFEALDYRMFPAEPLRFTRRVGISSGVGEQLTRRLWRRGNIYQVAETLAFHGEHASVMNADARKDRPLDNRERALKKRSATLA